MSLSRREVLSVLLGAPLAAQACRRRPFRRIEGEIRGGSLTVGHRLRDATVERATGPATRVRVAIVGAGPSGLSAAWRLERLGEKGYAVFDLERRAGGTSTYGTDGVVPYPWGAHYVPLPSAKNRALVRLLGEVDALDGVDEKGAPRAREHLRIREPEERIFVDGRWHEGLFPFAGSSEADRAELERFTKEIDRWVAWRDAAGRRAFTIPVSRCSPDSEVTVLDRISAAKWLDDRGFRSKRLRWYVEYATRDDYGLSLERTSAWAMLFYFASRTGAPGAESAPFIAWPEGNGHLVRHLERVVGDRLHTESLVTDVVPRDDEVELSVLDTAAGTLRRYVAERVILAVPQFVCARILAPWRPSRPAHLSAFESGVWLVANLHLKRRPASRGFPTAWDNVLFDSPSLGYVVATHQKLADTGPTVWTYYLPLTDPDPSRARRELLALEHGAICDTILSDLSRAHERLEAAVERIDVWRWGHAMALPTPGFVWGNARARAASPVGRVHFAHSDLSGLALFEEAQDRGVHAAEAVLGALGRSVDSITG